MQDFKGLYSLSDEVNTPPKYYFEDEVREGFFVSAMMKRFWAAQLKVLAEIDKICRKHDLKWYAGFGTLMGAVRHGGFIPWDDDMDICMMREDYVRFIEYAKNDLPKEYKIITIQLEEEYEYISGRILGSVTMSLEDEYLKNNFGCPYFAGIDIFPLDGIMKDEEKEQDRVTRIRDVSWAVFCIKENRCDDRYRMILEKIQKDNNVVFKEKDKPARELMLLADSMYSEMGTKDAEYVAMMSNWVKYGVKYSKKWFDNIIYLPFEYVSIPVPIEYETVLWSDYGSYMNVVKGGGAHDYPLYSKQEVVIKGDRGINTLRYTMPENVHDIRNNVAVSDKCNEMIALLDQVADKIGLLCGSGEYMVASQLITGSIALADSLHGVLSERERYGSATHFLMDKFRKLIADQNSGTLNSDHQIFISTFKAVLGELSDIIEDESRKKEILFLPIKAEWWYTMEPEWRGAISDPNNDVYVMPLVYLEKDFVQENGEEKNDASLFPEYVKTVDIKDYNIARRHPDAVYIQVPYDGYNTTIAIPSYFYSDNLLNLTDELVYVPCYETDDPESDDDKIVSALRIIIEQPAVYNADRVIVRNELQRKVYIDTLVGITGEDTKNYWEDKVSVSENGQYYDITRAVRSKIGEKDKQIFNDHYKIDGDVDKKVILTQLNPAYVVHNGTKAVNRLRNALAELKAEDDSFIIVFEPHFAMDQLMELLSEKYADILVEFRSFIEEIRNDDRIIYDEDRLIEMMDLDVADAYYGTTGVLGHRCMLNQVPVMYMANICI